MYDCENAQDDIAGKHKEKFIVVDPPNGPIDLSLIPTNPMAYLQSVQFERKNCPSLLRAEMDPQKFSSNQSVLFKTENVKIEPPPGFAASASWKRHKVIKFMSMRDEFLPRKDNLKMHHNEYQKLLPKISKELDWCSFCLGNKCMELVRSKSNCELSEEEKFGQNDGHPPYVRFVVHLSTLQIIKLLEYHIKWLKHLGFSHHQGRWIFALLGCLEEPLFPDSIYVLRKVVIMCSVIRKKLKNKHDSVLLALNHIICIITNYFKQKDIEDVDGPE